MRGYDTFWMAEHHFQPEGTELIPNLLMMAMHLCGVTRNINIGCGFNIVPMWHPLRLAKDYAMADILTGGRIIFVARSWQIDDLPLTMELWGDPAVTALIDSRGKLTEVLIPAMSLGHSEIMSLAVPT
jgi:alkanesulfonate monooxygenase SsuD/methylene tetrahydromethanopterin reductase-like flavin-dependent oxidoreductase (luciferase family)